MPGLFPGCQPQWTGVLDSSLAETEQHGVFAFPWQAPALLRCLKLQSYYALDVDPKQQ